MDDSPVPDPRADRRRFLGGLGALGGAALAGCGSLTGDGGGDGDDGTTFTLYAEPPAPSVIQHNPYNLGSLMSIASWCRHSLVNLSAVNDQPVGDLAADWSYEAGIIDLDLHDDFYWWDGTNVTVDDLTTTMRLQEYVNGEDYYPLIEDVERTGDHSVRFLLGETYREQPALLRSIVGIEPYPREIFEEWVTRFEEATTEDARIDVMVELAQKRMEQPVRAFYNAPFEMVDIGEYAYELALRSDEEPTPHYVDAIDFETVAVEVNNESTPERLDFREGDLPFTDLQTIVEDGGDEFDSEVVELAGPSAAGAYVFNCASGPTANVQFRRAWALMLDRANATPQDQVTDELPTGVTSPAVEEQYFGPLLDSFESYGPEEVREAAAEEAMLAGGFERDSAGDWLYQSGSTAGEPISIDITTSTLLNGFTQVADPFVAALDDFGISLSFSTIGDIQQVLDTRRSGNFTVGLAYWGANVPLATAVYANAFTRASSTYSNSQFPPTWEGPPVGEPDAEATTTHEVESAVDRMNVVSDDEEYQTLLDRLGWVYNQALPVLPIASQPDRYRVNTESWDWQLPPAEHPEAWLSAGQFPLSETVWTMGLVSPAGGGGDDPTDTADGTTSN